MKESTIYWCDECNIPLFDDSCPLCGNKARRIGSDLRPVFPEERLLLEIIIGEPFKYKDASVWNASGNHYYANGKKVNFSVSDTKSLDVKHIREQLKTHSCNNNYEAFERYLELFIKANSARLSYISNEAIDYVRSVAQDADLTDMFVSFSGGKDRYGYTRVGCWMCPNNSMWSEFLSKIYMPEQYKRWHEFLIQFAKRLGKPDPEIYVSEGKWKARQGGAGIEYAKTSVLTFEPCALQENTINFELQKPITEELYELFKPFGKLNFDIGNKRLL